MQPPIIAPPRSHDQRMQALQHANVIRTRRAEAKRQLKAGAWLPETILLDPPDYALNWKVLDLLCALPKWGRTKANRALTANRISHSKTVAGLSDRQRVEIAAYVRERSS